MMGFLKKTTLKNKALNTTCLTLFLFFTSADVKGQFSFICIQDKIILTDSNLVVFNSTNHIDSSILKMFNDKDYSIDNNFEIDFLSMSSILDSANQKRNLDMVSYSSSNKSFLKQREEFGKYAFQVYPLLNSKGGRALFVVYILKSAFPNWREMRYFIHDGGHAYNIIGFCCYE